MKTVKIEVTRADIDRGRPRFNNLCPVALAINRALPGHAWRVDGWRAEGDGGGRFALPWRAVVFVSDYDHGKPVQPFTFEVQT
jgi:hypothetical protein